MSLRKLILLGALAAMLPPLISGCAQEAPDMTTPPPPVAFTQVSPADMELSEELIGRVAAVRVAEIRAQVTGIVQRRLFDQGADIRAGQPLFQINPAPYQADVATSTAALQRAEAVLARATTQTERLKPLADSEAISQQSYDDAASQQAQARADVAQARAELARRRLDLKFATVEAPISGRIDQAQLTEGALVGPSDTAPLARIQQIDQVYVDIRQPSASMEAMQQMVEAGGMSGKNAPVTLLRDNGEPLGLTGKPLFSGITVDEGTGDVLMRVAVDNRARRLLPGMFVRARVMRARFERALSVPQQAVVREGNAAKVWLLKDKNRVRAVPVELGELIGDRYRVRRGLSAGDRVVVEGMDRMANDAVVTPRAWRVAGADAAAVPPSASAAQ